MRRFLVRFLISPLIALTILFYLAISSKTFTWREQCGRGLAHEECRGGHDSTYTSSHPWLPDKSAISSDVRSDASQPSGQQGLGTTERQSETASNTPTPVETSKNAVAPTEKQSTNIGSSEGTRVVGEDEPRYENKIIVMASLRSENTEWVVKDLPEWQHAIYVTDDQNATLHTAKNKGRESLAYLTYLVDNYHSLPETIVFLHSHKDGYPRAWHTDFDHHDNVKAVRHLKIDFVQRKGYANLRCIWEPGCPDEMQAFRTPKEEHRTTEHILAETWPKLFNNTDIPPVIGAACCSQFAVSRDQVLKRPLEDYQRLQQWVLETDATDHISGRLMEYLWHIMFGQEAI
ncbi:MAG: hypothetical protein Q9213_000128 [Squamulea squamosa]